MSFLGTPTFRQATASKFAGGFIITSSGSGGVALTASTSSMPYGITVKNVGNAIGVSGIIHVGSTIVPPFVSGGFPLALGESVVINVNRADTIRVYGTISGIHAGWSAVFD